VLTEIEYFFCNLPIYNVIILLIYRFLVTVTCTVLQAAVKADSKSNGKRPPETSNLPGQMSIVEIITCMLMMLQHMLS